MHFLDAERGFMPQLASCLLLFRLLRQSRCGVDKDLLPVPVPDRDRPLLPAFGGELKTSASSAIIFDDDLEAPMYLP